MEAGPGEASGLSSGLASEATTAPVVLRVARGNPTPEEVAALVAVLAALGVEDEPAAPSRRSAWSDPSWQLIGPATRRGGWRASALPR